jgi:secreted PhoX family phosphatase
MKKSVPTLEQLMQARISRREWIAGAGRMIAATSAMALLPHAARASKATVAQSANSSGLHFTEISKTISPTHHVAQGYDVRVLLRWGDKITPDAPAFDVYRQTPAAQTKQFGTNCDYTAFLPFPKGSGKPDRGLMWANHEYPDSMLMFPQTEEETHYTPELKARIEMASVGGSLIELRRENAVWKPVLTSNYNRRITAETPIQISGPAAGHARMKTSYDPAGTRVLGTLANCAGGITPWGTILTCEENFHDYFSGDTRKDHAEFESNHRRYGIGKSKHPRNWGDYAERFDVGREPNEPNRFGWVVEIDPYDPHSMPVKRTALGRFKHESATVVLSPDNRVVVYSGDDEKLEYLYRFVSRDAFDPDDRSVYRNILDHGELSVAKLDADGTLNWLPLQFGQGPLTKANGFRSQADVLIETRRAADLLGATPMDRPEDVEVSPVTGKVYCSMTKNNERSRDKVDAANPRANNKYGHILELVPPNTSNKPDHAAAKFIWNIFILAGNPSEEAARASYPTRPSEQGWFTNPDNLAFDPAGRLWIATDGQPASIQYCNGLYACETEGETRGAPKLFFTAPIGAEVTGPSFTPDGSTLFLSIQHPSEDSGLDAPDTRWPDFGKNSPPRSSIVVITKKDGEMIGS